MLDSTLDLKLAYNEVDYVVTGYATSSNKWSLTIVFSDYYDFAHTDWKTVITTGDGAAALNNMGAQAQAIGAVVPFHIQVTVNTTVLERVVEINRIDPPTQLLK